MKYFLYIRKSSPNDKKQFQSLQDQKRELISLVTQRGLTVVDTISDQKTAKDPSRPGFNQLIERIKGGEAQGVIVWKLDRLSRNPVDDGTVRWLLQQGVIQEVVTPHKTYYTTDNVISMAVELSMATQYVIDLSRGVKRGMKSKMLAGWFPGRAPIGYINEPEAISGKRKILKDPIYFPIIKDIWRRFLTGHYSKSCLYQHMQQKCPIMRNGKVLSRSVFFRIFLNPFYCGLFQWGGKLMPGAHEAIITKEQFDRAQRVLISEQQVRQSVEQYDLKKILRCGHCGSLLTAYTKRKWVKSKGDYHAYVYYKCSHHKAGIDCKQPGVSEAVLKSQILQLVLCVVFPEHIVRMLDNLAAQQQITVTASAREQELLVEHTKLTKQAEKLKQSLVSEADAELRQWMKAARDKVLLEAHAVNQQAAEEKSKRKAPTAQVRHALELSVTLAQKFLTGTFEQRQQVLTDLGSNWRVNDKKVSVDLHFPMWALQKTKEFHTGIKPRFELMKTFTKSRLNAQKLEVDLIWWHLWDIIKN